MFSSNYLISAATAIAGLVITAAAKDSNAITTSPPMGYSPFYWVQQEYNESVMVDAANAMLNLGLYDAGYNRLNLDGGWSRSSRDGNKALTWNTTKFPHGMPWLTKFAKSKGFIPGIFTQAGTEACKFHAFPGSYGHEKVDFDAFVKWGFEYLIVDGCNFPNRTVEHSNEVWGKWYKYLKAADWPIYMVSEEQVYLINDKDSAYNRALDFTWQHGPSARTSGDSAKYWQPDSWAINMRAYEHNMRAARYQTGDFVNDPDKLTPGNPYLAFEQERSLFALWCTMSAPLIISADMSNLTNATLGYLTNQRLLDVDQDKSMAPATLASRDDTWDVLTKSLHNGDRVLTILNRGKKTESLKVSWSRLGFLDDDLDGVTSMKITNLWTGKEQHVPIGHGHVNAADIASDGTAVFRLSPTGGNSSVTPTGVIFNLYLPIYGAAKHYPSTCLTDNTSGQVHWSACNASDAQVWSITDNGHISSLLRPKACLADVNGDIRSRNSQCDKWTYSRSGNLKSKSTKHCLTGGTPSRNAAGSGKAKANDCGSYSVHQMFGVPGGVALVDGEKPQP